MTQDQTEDLEERVFKSLSNKKRREIIRYLGEKHIARFNKVNRDLGYEDSASLTYHLAALDPLITKEEDGYRLSPAGRDAYNLIDKITSVSNATAMPGSVRRQVAVMIIANAILWAAAILSVRLNEGKLQGATLYSFSALWFISNIFLDTISQRLSRVSR
jgi:DNA-binding HxlR family transcriptional regulator